MRKIAILGLACAASTCGLANAAVISSWGFEGLAFTAPANTGSTLPVPSAGSFASDTGNGAVSASHAAAATVWSTPAGNGSVKSLSSNTWASGDYYEFTSNTTGFTGIMMLLDATGSGTGPRDFKVQYSLTGTGGTYIDAPSGTYSLTLVTFSSGTEQSSTPPRFLFDLSSISGLDNNANASFRLVDTGTTSINNGTVAAGGTSRIDNVIIGTNLVIPEPASFGLIAAGAGLLIRRRK